MKFQPIDIICRHNPILYYIDSLLKVADFILWRRKFALKQGPVDTVLVCSRCEFFEKSNIKSYFAGIVKTVIEFVIKSYVCNHITKVFVIIKNSFIHEMYIFQN